MGYLYKLSFNNDKAYIGITSTSIKRRICLHLSQTRKGRPGALQNAIRKYGDDSFKVQILGSNDSWENLCLMEVDAIKEHKTLFPNGYNLTIGGEGSVGAKRTEEVKLACRERALKRAQSGVNLPGILGNNVGKGYKHTPESIKKISEAGRGAIFTEERKAKIGASKIGNKNCLGKPCKEETKLKISMAQKGRKLTEDHRAKLSIAAKNRAKK